MSIAGITDALRKPRVASATQTPDRPITQSPEALKPAGKGREGKRSDPNFERLTIYVRKDTRLKARRKWEDAGNRDESELIQKLLSEWVSAQ